MIKLISEKLDFRSQCRSCMSSTDCYKIVISTEYGSFSSMFTLCKNCLKVLQKQIKEQIGEQHDISMGEA